MYEAISRHSKHLCTRKRLTWPTQRRYSRYAARAGLAENRAKMICWHDIG